jgi:hypothetical protein
MKRVLIVAFVALSCVPGIAYADSDGSQSLGSFSGGRAYPKPIFTSLHRKPLGSEYVRRKRSSRESSASSRSRRASLRSMPPVRNSVSASFFRAAAFENAATDSPMIDGPMARSPDRQRFSLKYLICHS